MINSIIIKRFWLLYINKLIASSKYYSKKPERIEPNQDPQLHTITKN
jgi:hypothetical protein